MDRPESYWQKAWMTKVRPRSSPTLCFGAIGREGGVTVR